MMAHLSFWIIAFVYCFVTFMVAVLAWSRGYNVGKSEGFRRGFKIARNTAHPLAGEVLARGN